MGNSSSSEPSEEEKTMMAAVTGYRNANIILPPSGIETLARAKSLEEAAAGQKTLILLGGGAFAIMMGIMALRR